MGLMFDEALVTVVTCDEWRSYWPPPPAPQLGESWPFEQVHMLGLEQKPSPHEFLQIAGETKRRWDWFNLFFISSAIHNETQTELSHAYFLSSPLGFVELY